MKKRVIILCILLAILSICFSFNQTCYAKEDITLEIDAFLVKDTLYLNFLLGTSERAMWVNYLIRLHPTVQVDYLWSVPIPVTDPPTEIPLSFPFPGGLGMIGIWSGLFTEVGTHAGELAWVDTDDTSIVLLPDTGIELCYDDTQETECPVPGEPFYGQDAQYVSYPMSYTVNYDGTVTDNVTRLMWQQGTYYDRMVWDDAKCYCEDLELAGHTDWRLPDEYELQGIVHYGHRGPAIDTAYFPGTDPSSYSSYWSSSDKAQSSWYAWIVNFHSGGVTTWEKNKFSWVRCVRGDQREASFNDNGDGTVTDNVTRLMWQQEIDPEFRTWEDALSYCEDLELVGYTDWRLPDIKELRSIVDNTRIDPAIDTTYFHDAMYSLYCLWSSSTDSFEEAGARVLLIGFGLLSGLNKSYHSGIVRCVR